MLKWLHERAASKRYAHDLYGSIVTMTRNPVLYRSHGIPDTVEGRFETLILHVFLFVDRVHGDDPVLAQRLVDLFFKDMDTTSRELGVGDMVVPKKMRGLAAVFQERMAQYRACLEGDAAHCISSTFSSNAIEKKDGKDSPNSLKKYISKLRKTLSVTAVDDLCALSQKTPV